jgi:hypothetical protein
MNVSKPKYVFCKNGLYPTAMDFVHVNTGPPRREALIGRDELDRRKKIEDRKTLFTHTVN